LRRRRNPFSRSNLSALHQLHKFFDGTPVSYETIEKENWHPNIDDLRKKITPRTRAIVIINPNNPTGAVYDKKNPKRNDRHRRRAQPAVFSDEIYDQLTYEGEIVSAANIAKDVPVVGLNGFSKVYQMTGWRLGYMYFKGEGKQLQQLKDGVEKQCRIESAPTHPYKLPQPPRSMVHKTLSKTSWTGYVNAETSLISA
jgi:aspartate/methionine/tyrosine aminotransferase